MQPRVGSTEPALLPGKQRGSEESKRKHKGRKSISSEQPDGAASPFLLVLKRDHAMEGANKPFHPGKVPHRWVQAREREGGAAGCWADLWPDAETCSSRGG